MNWFLKHRQDLAQVITYMQKRRRPAAMHTAERQIPSGHSREEQLQRVLKYVLDENEFLSPHGIRSLSRVYKDHPYVLDIDGQRYEAEYAPAESTTSLFGGNSNWRGPVWFPVNFLLVEALQRYHHFYGDDLKVEHPTGSGQMMTLAQVS